MTDAPDWQRPPFASGNDLAVTHGAFSERRWRPIAEQLLTDLERDAPWCSGAAFAGTRWAWARAEAQLSLIADWLDEHGTIDDDGNVPACLTMQARLDATAAKARDKLGLSPLALGRLLGLLTSVDGPAAVDGLAALMRQGAAIRARAAGLPVADDTGGRAQLPSPASVVDAATDAADGGARGAESGEDHDDTNAPSVIEHGDDDR